MYIDKFLKTFLLIQCAFLQTDISMAMTLFTVLKSFPLFFIFRNKTDSMQFFIVLISLSFAIAKVFRWISVILSLSLTHNIRMFFNTYTHTLLIWILHEHFAVKPIPYEIKKLFEWKLENKKKITLKVIIIFLYWILVQRKIN